MKWLIASLLAVWFTLVAFLGAATGAFVRPAGTPPVPILLGVLVPLTLFVAAYLASGEFRRFTLSADPQLLTAIQAWRAGGLTFLALYVHGVLPGSFAWPAGMGDIAIGVTAPFLAFALTRRSLSFSDRSFVLWNALGILDLVLAITLGALSSGFLSAGAVTTAPMARLPLVFIPAFLVPFFLMLHLAVLLQARRKV